MKAFILAGGNSSRMGDPKEKLLLGSRTFLDLISATARKLKMPLSVVEKDLVPGCGPLGGVYTAFKQSNCDGGIFLSCDMPLISNDVISELHSRFVEGQKAIFTQDEEKAGFPFALFSSSLETVERQLRAKNYSLQLLAKNLGANFFKPKIGGHSALLNVNTPRDYQRARRLWSEQEARRTGFVLDIRNLSVRRGANILIRDFNWQIRRGEHWVILGANGSGKTTLLSALLGYVTPSCGQISVLGEEYGESDWPQLRKKIGVVSSTIRQMMPDNEPAWITVASGKYATIDYWGTPKGQDKAEALSMLDEIECPHIAERPWGLLSQGERQRVLIGRALIGKPTLLILDEPCAGLDPAAREHFLQFLEHLGRRRSAPALVLVTHHVEEIIPSFSHALLLKAGHKSGQGTVTEMINEKKLSEIFNNRVTLRKWNGRFSMKVKPKRGVII